LMTCILNGITNSATPNWQAVGGSSLCQYIFHTSGTTVAGGETVFGFYLNSTGATGGTSTQQELNLVRDLGTSILSGGSLVANTGIYPDGPDVITITATNLSGSSGNLQARLSWTEAQA